MPAGDTFGTTPWKRSTRASMSSQPNGEKLLVRRRLSSAEEGAALESWPEGSSGSALRTDGTNTSGRSSIVQPEYLGQCVIETSHIELVSRTLKLPWYSPGRVSAAWKTDASLFVDCITPHMPSVRPTCSHLVEDVHEVTGKSFGSYGRPFYLWLDCY